MCRLIWNKGNAQQHDWMKKVWVGWDKNAEQLHACGSTGKVGLQYLHSRCMGPDMLAALGGME